MDLTFGNMNQLERWGITFVNKEEFKIFDKVIIRSIRQMWNKRCAKMIELTNTRTRPDVINDI